jgi:hypothetical protein
MAVLRVIGNSLLFLQQKTRVRRQRKKFLIMFIRENEKYLFWTLYVLFKFLINFKKASPLTSLTNKKTKERLMEGF